MTTQMPPSSSPYSPGDGPQPYGTSPHGRPPAPGTNTMAILALVFVFVFSPLAIVFGIMGRRQIARTGESGRGLATAGLILGSLSVLVGVVVAVVVGIAAASAASTPVSPAPAVAVPAVPAPAAPDAGASDAGTPTAVAPEAVAAQIEGQTQGRATEAVCPGPLEARVGASVTCTATVEEEQRDITATVTDVQGSSVLFDIRG